MPLIDERTLDALLAEALAAARAETQKPRAPRRLGSLERAIRSRGCQEAIPPAFTTFDQLVALKPTDVPAIVWLLGKAQRAGSVQQSEAVLSAAHRLIHHLMPLKEIDLIRGMWLLLHHAGIDLDHAAIGAQLTERCGAEVGSLYLHEATHSAARMLGAPAIIPSAELVH